MQLTKYYTIRTKIIESKQQYVRNYLFKFPFAGYGYAICGGPDSSVFAAMGEWIFICETPHSTDASDNRNATCVSDAPSETILDNELIIKFYYVFNDSPHIVH